MRFLPSACLLFLALASLNNDSPFLVEAKKSSSSRSSAAARGSSSRSRQSSRSSSSRAPPVSRRKPAYDDYDEEEEEEEEEDFGFPDVLEEDEDDGYDEEEEEVLRPVSSRSRRSTSSVRVGPPPSRGPPPRKARPPPKRKKPSRQPEYVEDDYEYERPRRSSARGSRRGPPPRSAGGRRPPPPRRGHVVRYEPQPSAFTRGLTALRDHIPDPATVRDAAANSLSAARQTTSKISSTVYREVKGLTSSELEQVMLKATRPDDTPVKGKHAERLVGVTYQISGRYDIYDAVLRKLWGKMAEKDWRTKIKALYVLHRFAADGAPEHAPALKARLRELRRSKDPKRKDKYFNSKQLLAGDATPENVKFRAFMSRYAHYVLLRAQCFGGMFDEISHDPSAGKKTKKPVKPITSTALRTEHLEAAIMLLKAGVACDLKEGEECENTAIASERVASDLIGLTTAVAVALNRALKGDDLKGADPAIIKRWCEFYSEDLLPQTRSMVKKTSAKLDAYGLFLPSRMGASVSPEVLQKGLRADESKAEEEEIEEEEEGDEVSSEKPEEPVNSAVQDSEEEDEDVEGDAQGNKAADEDEYDEYDYEEEEYYDDEEA